MLVPKYFGTPLVEEGLCSLDSAQHAPQGEPERGGAYAEPESEPGYPEPEPGPSFGSKLRAEPEPKVGALQSRPEPGPAPEPEPEGGAGYPEPNLERVRQVKTSSGSQVPQPKERSKDPSNKVYFIAAQISVIQRLSQMINKC